MCARSTLFRILATLCFLSFSTASYGQGGLPVLRTFDHPDSMRWIRAFLAPSLRDYVEEPRGLIPPPPVTPRIIDRPGLYEVGRMANTLSMLYDNRNSIAHDPKSKQLMVAFRGMNRSIFGDGRSLFVRYAQRHGAVWTPASEDIARGEIAGYPSVFLANADNAPWPHAVMIWGRDTEFPNGSKSYGDVGTMYGGVAHPSVSIGSFRNPPRWGVPSEIVMDQRTGDLYTNALGIEPSIPVSTGEFYLHRSSDGGQRWEVVTFDNPVFTSDMVPVGFKPMHLRFEISPDGSTLVAAWVGVYMPNADRAMVLDSRHEIMWRISTDRGQYWGPLLRMRLSDLAGRPSPFEQKIAMTWDLDVVIDARNRLHFLTVCSADLDPFNPYAEARADGTIDLAHVDSTFATEVLVDSTGAHLLPIGPVRRIRTDRRSFTAAAQDERPYTFRNEPKWARNYDGTAIYAKWISPRATWTQGEENGQSYLYPDTLSQVYVNGRVADDTGPFAWYHSWAFDVPSENPPWRDSLLRVTDLPDIAAKCTQIARYAGNGGQLHIAFVEWGEGEAPDSDPMRSEQIVWYIKDTKVPVLDTEGVETTPPPAADAVLMDISPQPASRSAAIRWRLDRDAIVSMRVVDALGRVVAVPVAGHHAAGVHTAFCDTGEFPPGLYLVHLAVMGHVSTRRMIILR